METKETLYSISSSRLCTGTGLGLGLASTAGKGEMEKIMECPVCQEIPLPPIYTCETGHVICSECQVRLKKCVLCRSPYTTSRNFPLESMVEAASFYCNFRPKGCTVAATLKELKDHHAVCIFAIPLKCYKNASHDCNGASLYLSEYVDHLRDVHSLRILEPLKEHLNAFVESYAVQNWGDGSVTLKSGLKSIPNSNLHWKDCLLHYNGQVFTARVFSKGSLFYLSCMLIGERSEAAKYGVKITMKKTSASEFPKCEHTTTVASLEEVVGNNEIQGYLPPTVIHREMLQHLGKFTPSSTEAKGDEPGLVKEGRLSWCVKYEIITL